MTLVAVAAAWYELYRDCGDLLPYADAARAVAAHPTAIECTYVVAGRELPLRLDTSPLLVAGLLLVAGCVLTLVTTRDLKRDHAIKGEP